VTGKTFFIFVQLLSLAAIPDELPTRYN